MVKQIIILFLFLSCFSFVKAQEKEEKMFKYVVKKFRTFYPYMDSLVDNFTQESLMLAVFQDVDTIYFYDENKPKKSVITFLESNSKIVLNAKIGYLDSIGLKPIQLIQRGIKTLNSSPVGLLYRLKGSEKYSFRTYINTNLNSEVVNFKSCIFCREKTVLILLNKNNEKKIYDIRFSGKKISLITPSIDNHNIFINQIDIGYIYPKCFFQSGFASILVNNKFIFNMKVNRNGKIRFYTIRKMNESLSKKELKKLPKKEPYKGYEFLW